MIMCLPSIHEALYSIPNSEKGERGGEEMEGEGKGAEQQQGHLQTATVLRGSQKPGCGQKLRHSRSCMDTALESPL